MKYIGLALAFPFILVISFFLLMLLISFTIGIPFGVYYTYQWNNEVYAEWTLSDQASTIDKKLEHLKEFKSSLEREGLLEGQARWFFKTPATDLSNHAEILDSLIERLENTAELDKNSLEYQQALKQITTDEYQGFDTCIFRSGWLRQRPFVYLFTTTLGECQDGKYAGEQSSNY